jgi:hypothetical protein
MSHYQIRWAQLIKSAEAGRLSDNTIGGLYAALADANRVIVAARGLAHAAAQGRRAVMAEDCGDAPGQSSDFWVEEANERERQLREALEQLDRANDQGYPRRTRG